jgi:hypothetical protein
MAFSNALVARVRAIGQPGTNYVRFFSFMRAALPRSSRR